MNFLLHDPESTFNKLQVVGRHARVQLSRNKWQNVVPLDFRRTLITTLRSPVVCLSSVTLVNHSHS